MQPGLSDEARLLRLNEASLTRSFTPELDIDWSAQTTDDEFDALYRVWSLLVGTRFDNLEFAARVQFAKYQQMNLMMFTALLERHGIASLSRLYDLDSSQPFAEYVTHFIKEETYHYTMFKRAVARLQSGMPGAAPLPTRGIDCTLRWLFRGLGLIPSRRLRSNLTFLLFRFAEQVSMIANQTVRGCVARPESFVSQIWAYHALDEARHLAFDDMILQRNRLPRPLAALPSYLAAPCCLWLSLLLNANEIWIGQQVGAPVRMWHLPGLMRRTQALFKRRVFGLLSSLISGNSSPPDKEPARRES